MGREIKLGYKVRDIITGFEGIAIGRTDWLYSCARIGVRSETMEKGKPINDQWFDVQQLEILKECEPPVSKDNAAKKTGGNSQTPSRQNHG